jgi:hypothetical protein
MRRCPLLAFVLFVMLDIANPLAPGTFEIENEEWTEFHVNAAASRPARTVASADGQRTADLQPHKPQPTQRLVRAGRVTSDWLAIRQAHAPAPPPPPASEDH